MYEMYLRSGIVEKGIVGPMCFGDAARWKRWIADRRGAGRWREIRRQRLPFLSGRKGAKKFKWPDFDRRHTQEKR